MATLISRSFGFLALVAIAGGALPSRAATTLPGTVIDRKAPTRIATCSVDADDVTFVPHVDFANQLAKPVRSSSVTFGFVDTTGSLLTRVTVDLPLVGRAALPTFPAGATGVTCTLERARFADGSTYAFGAAPAGATSAAIVGGALLVGGAAALAAGHGGSSNNAAPVAAGPSAAPTLTAGATATPTVAPTATPQPSATPAPTATPVHTATPVPTATPVATATPIGATPSPVPTASPAPLATKRAIVTPLPTAPPRPAAPTALPTPPPTPRPVPPTAPPTLRPPAPIGPLPHLGDPPGRGH